MILPRNDYLLVVPYERPEESPGGIIIPDAYRTDLTGWLWEVVAVGPGNLSKKGVRKPCETQVDDIVQTEHKYACLDTGERDTDNRSLYLVSESQVALVRWRPES